MEETVTTTEWTPERRKIREVEREAFKRGIRLTHPGADESWVGDEANRLYPLPPPEYTYGREVNEPWFTGHKLRRRSDGRWEFRSKITSEWFKLMDGPRYDAHVRALAACVPLSDAECDALTLGTWWDAESRHAHIRDAFKRVLRGEVANG